MKLWAQANGFQKCIKSEMPEQVNYETGNYIRYECETKMCGSRSDGLLFK